MKMTAWIILLGLTLATSLATESGFRVSVLTGTAVVRHGVQEQWLPLAQGDVLKPEDSIELGKGSSATLLLPGGGRVLVTEQTILNLSDIRPLSQEDLLLLLAMENVRSIPERSVPPDGAPDAAITTMHGSREGSSTPQAEVTRDEATGFKEWRGAEVLFRHGYYATCILRIKSTLRVHPALGQKASMMLMAAEAMEKMGVLEEALGEYRTLLADSRSLTPWQQALTERKVAELEGERKR